MAIPGETRCLKDRGAMSWHAAAPHESSAISTGTSALCHYGIILQLSEVGKTACVGTHAAQVLAELYGSKNPGRGQTQPMRTLLPLPSFVYSDLRPSRCVFPRCLGRSRLARESCINASFFPVRPSSHFLWAQGWSKRRTAESTQGGFAQEE